MNATCFVVLVTVVACICCGMGSFSVYVLFYWLMNKEAVLASVLVE